MHRFRTIAILITILGCSSPAPAPLPSDDGASTHALARGGTSFAELEVPPHARPHRPDPPARIPLTTWSKAGGGWQTTLPVRTRNLYFFKPSAGMAVVGPDDQTLPHKYFAPADGPHWSYDAQTLTVHGLDARPEDGAWFFVYERATEREAALNLEASGLPPERFVRSTVQAGPSSRSGLLLPAPGRLSVDLEVPLRGELHFSPGLVQPEVLDGPPSDGATLTVLLTIDGEERELWSSPIDDDTFRPVRIDLGDHEGKQARLTFRTEPGADNRFDYVFLAEPLVATRKGHPKRVVLVFVDTLRPDHLGAYGYERDTTPALDAVAGAGVRFDQARSIAPWTLPSTRTMLTGLQPERFFAEDTRTLQARMSDAGFSTAMFAGNLYLSPNFGLHRDWDLHYVELLPMAQDQVDRALAWLDDHEGRDAFLLVHLMDAHLPYKEPDTYRDLFAGEAPASLKAKQFHRPQVVSARLKSKEDRQYVRDRYDNNIRYADDQLARLYARLGPDDVVLFVSDHGEEFWDHGGYEHGHALWDELLRIPLVLRAPGLPAGTVIDAPVSMLDVTPTLLDLVGLPLDGLEGTSLVAAARGEADALKALEHRDQAFGRPLYGKERWGVLADDLKYQTVGAKEMVHDIAADPNERKDLLPKDGLAEQMRERMGKALDREVTVAYRIAVRSSRRTPTDDFVAEILVPGGVRHAWVGADPTEASAATVAWSEDSELVTATWPAPFRGGRDVWIVPAGRIEDVTHKLRISTRSGPESSTTRVPAERPATLGDENTLLLKDQTGDRAWELGFGVTPVPGDDDTELSGADDEIMEQLKAMGYAVGDDEGEPKGGGKGGDKR